MRKPFIAANWKMNLNLQDAEKFIADFAAKLADLGDAQVDTAICPPFVYLPQVCKAAGAADSRIKIGAQNMHWEAKGAFTGEISADMLCDIGCSYVILGHSERRAMFGESDANVSRKALACFAAGLLPIVCVGETLEQREQGLTNQVVETQLRGSLADLTPAQIEATTIAYEPVWAIGTGKAATPEMAQEVHAMIRAHLAERYGETVGKAVRIQYGGSVKPGNIAELIAQPDIDGALVGGASLKADSFFDIVKVSSGK